MEDTIRAYLDTFSGNDESGEPAEMGLVVGKESMSAARGLYLIGLIPGCGYGDQACEIALGLDTLGVNVSWMPTVDNTAEVIPLGKAMTDVPLALHPRLAELWNRSLEARAYLLDVPPHRWHSHWLAAEPDLQPYCHIAWEADRLPPEWVEPLNRYKKIFVPSTFNRETFIEGGITAPVVVIPHIAREISPAGEPLDLECAVEQDYVFYTIGAWTTRKAMQGTVRAYLDAFSEDDDTLLIIKTEHFDQTAYQNAPVDMRSGPARRLLTTAWTLANILGEYSKPARVHLISNRISPGQIDQLHVRGDCFVSLAHCEGWGLGAFNAAQCGNPVIMTGWGGQLEFLGHDYPLLLDYRLRSTDQYPADGHFYRGAHVQWAEADRAHASELMRWAYQNRDQAEAIASTIQKPLLDKFSHDRVCSALALEMGFGPETR